MAGEQTWPHPLWLFGTPTPCLGLPLPHLCISMCDLQPGGISSASDGLCRDCPVITDVIHVQFVYLYRFIIHVV